jgi:uncharacterized repeat protein (TIGR03803 family)
MGALLATSAGASSNPGVVYNFTGGNDGGNAATGVVFDGQGNAYGTTVVGGIFGCGTVFKLIPGSGQWTRKTLWNFSCGLDGKNPHGGVTFDKNGNLYGTTVAGGNGGICTGDGCGVVFRISTHGGLRVLYNFTGGDDGFGPGSPVVFDSAGKLYSTAPDGGKHKKGVVFQLSFQHNHWVQTVIHAFTGHADGGIGSLGPLLIDNSTGTIYGVTEIDGSHNAGTAYKIVPAGGGTWTFTTIWGFRGTPDAGYPYGGLIADSHGNLFGTTYYGGANNLGSVFELKPNQHGTYNERVLYSFKGGKDGSLTTTTLIADGSGNLDGTTSGGGGSCDCGTIFKLTPSGTESILHRFGSSNTDAKYPYYGLTPDANGNLFTSTVAGGLYGQGTVYGITP